MAKSLANAVGPAGVGTPRDPVAEHVDIAVHRRPRGRPDRIGSQKVGFTGRVNLEHQQHWRGDRTLKGDGIAGRMIMRRSLRRKKKVRQRKRLHSILLRHLDRYIHAQFILAIAVIGAGQRRGLSRHPRHRDAGSGPFRR